MAEAGQRQMFVGGIREAVHVFAQDLAGACDFWVLRRP